MHGVGTEVVTQVFARGRLRAAARRCRSRPQPDPDFPTVAFPNPEEPGALDLALALARDARRRPDHRQRPGRRPVRRRRADRREGGGGCCAATRSACCSRMPCCIRGFAARTRPRSSRRRCWRRWPSAPGRVRRDAHRLQVDLARRPRPGVRVRGGARVRGRAGAGPRQGRHQRGAARRRARGRAEGRTARRCRNVWTSSPPSTAGTPPTSCRCASTTCRSSADDDGATARRRRRPRCSARPVTVADLLPDADVVRLTRRRRARRRAAVRHRAEAKAYLEVVAAAGSRRGGRGERLAGAAGEVEAALGI